MGKTCPAKAPDLYYFENEGSPVNLDLARIQKLKVTRSAINRRHACLGSFSASIAEAKWLSWFRRKS
jgi:hypothetical protein